MTSNLACIGLAVDDPADVERLVPALMAGAVWVGSRHGVDVVRWEDASGARVVLGLKRGAVIDLLPALAGPRGAWLTDLHALNDEVWRATVVDLDGSASTIMAVEIEQRRLLDVSLEGTREASVVAFGSEVTVHPDAAAFDASDASALADTGDADTEPPAHYAESGLKWPPRMAAESFISYGLFGDPAAAQAHSRLNGTVLEADRRINGLTGQAFQVARVRTVGFEAEVCLAATEHPETPHPGSVVAGTVFLVASIDLPDRVLSRGRFRLPWN